MFWKKSKKRGPYKKVSSETKVNEILNKALANDLKQHPSLAIHFARQRFFKGMEMPDDEDNQSTGDPNVDSVLKWASGVEKIKEKFGGGGELFSESTIQTLIKHGASLMEAAPQLMEMLSKFKIIQGSKPSQLVEREMGIRTLPPGEQPQVRALPEGTPPEQPKPEAITPKPEATTQEQPTPEPPDDEVKEQRLVASINQLAAMPPEQAAALVFAYREDGDLCQLIYEHVDSGYSFDDLLAKVDELEENQAYAYLKESLSKLKTASLAIFFDELVNLSKKELGLDESGSSANQSEGNSGESE